MILSRDKIMRLRAIDRSQYYENIYLYDGLLINRKFVTFYI